MGFHQLFHYCPRFVPGFDPEFHTAFYFLFDAFCALTTLTKKKGVLLPKVMKVFSRVASGGFTLCCLREGQTRL